MKSQRSAAIILGLTACVALFVLSCHRVPYEEPDRAQPVAGVRMQDVLFFSTALGREMPYRVYLPADWPTGQKLPVVYLLHGAWTGFRDWSNYSHAAEYARHGVIFVMPEGDLSYYMNAAGAKRDRYEDYITKDLIADVESRFPVKSDREDRAIIGVSMGGFAAIEYALTRPDLFVFVGALSPAIDAPRRGFNIRYIDQWWRFRTIFGPMGSEERKARDPLELVQTANPQATPYIYMTSGDNEALLDPIQHFATRLKQRGFAFEFHIKPGGHDWGEWNEQVPGCFASLLQHLGVRVN
ncbi:MAG TPA: alpha/beta hydrolase-fold protein [Terracidiphilus sp.]|nr:alpha/beta hydrolase-fold protein [Terracidiphilus sp.]